MKLKMSLLSLVVLAACGRGEASKPRDVATDLGVADGSTYYYYQENGQVFRGKCQAGQPILKSFCQAGLASVDQVAFKDRFALTLHTALSELSDKIVEQDGLFEAADAAYHEKLDVVGAKNTALSALVTTHQTKVAARTDAENVVAQFNAQITLAESQLAAQPNDATLAAALQSLKNDRAPYLATKTSLDAEIAALDQNMTTTNLEVGQAVAARDLALQNRATADAKLNGLQARYAEIVAEKAKLNALMEKLASGVRYQALSTDNQLPEYLEFIKFFDNAFDGQVYAVQGVSIDATFDFANGLQGWAITTNQPNSGMGWALVGGKLKSQTGASYSNNLLTEASMEFDATSMTAGAPLALDYDFSLNSESGYDKLTVYAVKGSTQTQLATYTGNAAQTASVSLAPYVGGKFTLKFVFSSDGSNVGTGAVLSRVRLH